MSGNEPVRWGIISGARIGLNSVVPAIQQSSNGRVVCIGTPNPDAARARSAPVRECAEKLGIPRIYDSYAAVVDDPEVEAVYIPLPNSLHREWTVRAAERGKHVLCEKPFAATVAECREMIEACRQHGVLLMEGFMYRFHPQQAVIQEVLRNDRLGAIQMVRCAFTFRLNLTDTRNIRLSRELWGGALMDVGCYCINASRHYFGAEPVSVLASARIPSELGVDTTLHAVLEFESGFAPFVVSFEMVSQPQIEIVGERGRLEIPACFTPGEAAPTVALTVDGKREELAAPAGNSYQCQVESFSRSVRTGQPPMLSPEDGLANMRVIEAIRRTVADGGRVKLASLA